MIDALTTDRSGRVSAQWRTFRAYWLGLTVSTIGDSFTLVALPIAAYTINRSSVLVGFVSATTRDARGLRCSTNRLIVPPLPAASRPSKTRTCLAPASMGFVSVTPGDVPLTVEI